MQAKCSKWISFFCVPFHKTHGHSLGRKKNELFSLCISLRGESAFPAECTSAENRIFLCPVESSEPLRCLQMNWQKSLPFRVKHSFFFEWGKIWFSQHQCQDYNYFSCWCYCGRCLVFIVTHHNFPSVGKWGQRVHSQFFFLVPPQQLRSIRTIIMLNA